MATSSRTVQRVLDHWAGGWTGAAKLGAHILGSDAADEGQDEDLCPFQEPTLRAKWQEGYRDCLDLRAGRRRRDVPMTSEAARPPARHRHVGSTSAAHSHPGDD
jgi:ribosome modulation factor